MNSFLILIILVALFQTVSGQITVTLLTDRGQAIVSETIQFTSQQNEALASCVTNFEGRCTITLLNVPADRSGLIRGALITRGGRRPVIWPGGELIIELSFDETGQLEVPSDAYVTRTPQNTPLSETTPEPTAEATAEPTVESAVESAVEPTPETRVEPPLDDSTSTVITPEQASPSYLHIWSQFLLVTLLFAAIVIYIYKAKSL